MATDRRVVRRRWAEAGVVAAGLGAAMLGGAGAAAAAPADSGHGSSAVSTPTAPASAQTTATTAAASQVSPLAATRQERQASARIAFVGPLRATVLASQAYSYSYPLMEYEQVRQTVPDLNTRAAAGRARR